MVCAVGNPEFDRLAGARYILVTTFRKDGTPVATPVWQASQDHRLLVMTDRSSGKVKRLRRNQDVLVAPCDVRGSLQGEPVQGRATVIEDSAEVAAGRKLIERRYGLTAKVMSLAQRLRGKKASQVVLLGIEITEQPHIPNLGEHH